MLDMQKKYRLVTRSDFDGLICAVLLKELEIINEIKFVHPKDMQDGKVPVTSNDITANLPYRQEVALGFDHHYSETQKKNNPDEAHLIDAKAPSTARIIYDYFGGKERFKNISEELMHAVDKADAGLFTIEDILYPKRWELLNFITDPRTGLGRFKNFKVSNYDLMMHLIDYCKYLKIEEILNLPDIKERVDLFFQYHEKFQEQIFKCSKVYKNLVVLDLRSEETIYPGNRFIIYALFPTCNISMHILWGLNKQNTVFAVGKSIFKRQSKTNVGELMLKYGGGGHINAGTCQIENNQAENVMKELIKKINQDG